MTDVDRCAVGAGFAGSTAALRLKHAGRSVAVLSAAIGRIDAATRVRHQSLHDPLTGLPNRTVAYRRITGALRTANRERTLPAVLPVDVDDFKVVNDSLGHAHGDVGLQRLGRLAGAVRPADTVARLGGDEFVLVCEDFGTADTATALAARITTGLALIQMLG
ncbi:diguanylate cyclase domain-containing protein [Nocardia xishanensis]|uniref:Diguanylate cyclase domain-containing protein n=1 Tax=Nocardia xishanensis TaxID=238964 RepID=A0ABW7XBG7_9NOCA